LNIGICDDAGVGAAITGNNGKTKEPTKSIKINLVENFRIVFSPFF